MLKLILGFPPLKVKGEIHSVPGLLGMRKHQLFLREMISRRNVLGCDMIIKKTHIVTKAWALKVG